MSKELKITKERIKKLVAGLSSCPEAREAVEDAFPEAFEREWEDVTGKCGIMIAWEEELVIYYKKKSGDTPFCIFYVTQDGLEPTSFNEGNFKVEKGNQIFDRYGHILKKT